jgi:hypothetical protein
MKNQNELTVEQIGTMFKDAGETFTTEEIKSLLSNEKTKELVYKLYEARTELKKLKTEHSNLKQ